MQALYSGHFFRANRVFFLLIVTLLALIPSPFLIEHLALKLNTTSVDFFSQPWRLITGHFIHNNWPHLLINLFNLMLLRLAFYEWLSGRQLLGLIIFSSLLISLGLWLTGSLSYYLGFSGIFHALLIYLLLRYWRKMPLLFSVVLLLVIAKVSYEQIYGPSQILESFISLAVANEAHTLGVVSGIGFWASATAFNYLAKNNWRENQ